MFPQQTQTANCAGFLGHCKDRPLWPLHNCEALGQLVAIKIMEDPPDSATLDPRNRDSGSEQSSCWLSGTQRVSECGLQLTIYSTDPCGVRELGFLSAFSGKYFPLFLTCSDLETVHVSSGWARGLFLVCQVSLMMGIKPQETEASWTGNKPQSFGGHGIFFLPPNGKILAWA